jgi:hypothetical protein
MSDAILLEGIMIVQAGIIALQRSSAGVARAFIPIELRSRETS